MGGTLHETGHTHKIMGGNHISSFRHLDSPADSVKDRMIINKVVLMIDVEACYYCHHYFPYFVL